MASSWKYSGSGVLNAFDLDLSLDPSWAKSEVELTSLGTGTAARAESLCGACGAIVVVVVDPDPDEGTEEGIPSVVGVVALGSWCGIKMGLIMER